METRNERLVNQLQLFLTFQTFTWMAKRTKLFLSTTIAKVNQTQSFPRTRILLTSCKEIRRKIAAYFRTTGITQAEFLRQIGKQIYPEQKLQSKLLNDFRKKAGLEAGNTSAVFHASYVYFEKLRLKEGKPKSKHRLDMEGQWALEGFDITHRGSGKLQLLSRVSFH